MKISKSFRNRVLLPLIVITLIIAMGYQGGFPSDDIRPDILPNNAISLRETGNSDSPSEQNIIPENVDEAKYREFIPSNEKYSNVEGIKKIVITENLRWKILNTPRDKLVSEEQTLLLSMTSLDSSTVKKLENYRFEFLDAINIGIIHAPLAAVDEIALLPGIQSIYLDQYRTYIEEDWEMKAPTSDDFKVQTFAPEKATGARDLLDLGFDGTGVTIAVIDTGIDKRHPDLDDLDNNPATVDPKVIMEKSFIDYDDDGIADKGPEDEAGHGTHVAGIAAGNGLLLGMAPGATLMNARVLDAYGGGTFEWIMRGVNWAATNGADIISMSLGGFYGDVQSLLNAAVDAAAELGIVVAIAASNSGPGRGTISSPGLASRALTIGATDYYDNVVFFSSRGPSITGVVDPDIVAPGHEILSTVPDGGYAVFSGTSMATPAVAGGIALLMEAFPASDAGELRSALMQSAADTGKHVFDQGAGFMDLVGAYNLLNSAVPYYAFPEFPADKALSLAPGETFTYQLDLFVNGIASPSVVPTGFVSGVSVLSVETGPSSWLRAKVEVVMPTTAVNGTLEIKDGATTLISVPLSLIPDVTENDGNSGTDAGETFSGALSLNKGTVSVGLLDENDYEDIYNITVVANNDYNIILTNMTLDLDLFIQDENGSMFAYGFNWGYEENVTFTALSSGIYSARILRWDRGMGNYSILFSDSVGGGTAGGIPAELTGNYGDLAVDYDSNALNDGFNITVEIMVYEELYYDVLFSISQNRSDYSPGLYYVAIGWETFYLTPGLNTISLFVNGTGLQSSGYDGAYVLNDILLGDPRTYTILNFETAVYTTASYNHLDFDKLDMYLNSHSIAFSDTDGNTVDDSVLFTFEFYFPLVDSYNIDFVVIDNAQQRVLGWETIFIDINVTGLQTVEGTVPGQNMKNMGDVYLAAVFTGMSDSFIPLYDKILESSLNALEDQVSYAITDTPVDTDGNGVDDSLRFTFTIDSKIEFEANAFVSYAFSTVNETAMPLWGGDISTLVTPGITELSVDFPINIFTSKDLLGPFLIPNVGISSWDIDIGDPVAYITSAYSRADFEDPVAYITDIFVENNVNATIGGFTLSVELFSSTIQDIDFNIDMQTYERIEGDYYEGFYETVSLTAGSQNVTFDITGRDLYQSKYVGSIEIEQIRLFKQDANYSFFGKTIDFVYHAGIVQTFSYADYIDYADTYFTGLSAIPYDTNTDGLFDGVTVTFNVTVKVAGDYDISLSTYSWTTSSDYNNYSNQYLDVGNYSFVYDLSAAIAIRTIGEMGIIKLRITNWENDWRDTLRAEVSFNIDTFDYVFPILYSSYVGDIGNDVNADGLFESISFKIDVNITTPGAYRFRLNFNTLFEFTDHIEIFGWDNVYIDEQNYSAGIHTLDFVNNLEDIKDILRWFYSDDDIASLVSISFELYNLIVWDDLGRIYLDMPTITSASYDFVLLDLSPAVSIIGVTYELQDTDGDGDAELFAIFVELNITRPVEFEASYSLTFMDNTGTYYRLEATVKFVETVPRVHTVEIVVFLSTVFGNNIPTEFKIDFYIYLYDTANYDFLDEFSFGNLTTVNQDDLVNLATTSTTNTTSTTSTVPTTTTTTDPPSQPVPPITTEESAFIPGFSYLGAIFSLISVVMAMIRRRSK